MEPARTAKPKRARNWDALAAVIASLIGALALVVSAYTAYVQRQQVRAQVWPLLVVGDHDPERSLVVHNKGVGPAIVRTAQVFVDGRPQADWKRALGALGVPAPHAFLKSTISPNVLSPGERVQVIQFADEAAWERFHDAAVARMSVDICFCSTLGECWMYRDRHPVGFKEVGPLVEPIDRCPRLPKEEMFSN